jgi:hypothetical protein
LEAETVLGDYRTIEKPYEPVTVSDQDVADVLKIYGNGMPLSNWLNVRHN